MGVLTAIVPGSHGSQRAPSQFNLQAAQHVPGGLGTCPFLQYCVGAIHLALLQSTKVQARQHPLDNITGDLPFRHIPKSSHTAFEQYLGKVKHRGQHPYGGVAGGNIHIEVSGQSTRSQPSVVHTGQHSFGSFTGALPLGHVTGGASHSIDSQFAVD